MEVIGIASNLLIAAAFFQISDSIQVVFLGALRGLQDVKVPTVLTFISYWVVSVFLFLIILEKKICMVVLVFGLVC